MNVVRENVQELSLQYLDVMETRKKQRWPERWEWEAESWLENEGGEGGVRNLKKEERMGNCQHRERESG